MNVMVPIPDDLAARFGSEAELSRRTVEALALEAYRTDRLTGPELGQLLGLEAGPELDSFLEGHGIEASDPKQENARRTSLGHTAQTDHAAADDLVEQFRAFAKTHTLGGLDIKELISEGRR